MSPPARPIRLSLVTPDQIRLIDYFAIRLSMISPDAALMLIFARCYGRLSPPFDALDARCLIPATL